MNDANLAQTILSNGGVAVQSTNGYESAETGDGRCEHWVRAFLAPGQGVGQKVLFVSRTVPARLIDTELTFGPALTAFMNAGGKLGSKNPHPGSNGSMSGLAYIAKPGPADPTLATIPKVIKVPPKGGRGKERLILVVCGLWKCAACGGEGEPVWGHLPSHEGECELYRKQQMAKEITRNAAGMQVG